MERLEPRWVLAAGALDTTFGLDGADADTLPDGVLIGNFGFAANSKVDLNAVTTQADGKIVAAGFVDALGNASHDFLVARFNSNGSLDNTFGSGGFTTFDFGPTNGDSTAQDVAIDSLGRIIVVGNGPNSSFQNQWAVARLTSNGILDTSFNGTGKVLTGWGSFSGVAYGVAVQSDGKIVVTGDVRTPNFISEFDFGVVRYNTDGTLDTNFGSGGKVETDFFGRRDQAFDVAIQSNGRIVVGGYASTTTRSDNFALARYDSSGNLDTTFGSGGLVNTDIDPVDFVSQDRMNSLAIQADGRIVAAGYSLVRLSPFNSFDFIDFSVARYLPNGSLDTSFNPGAATSSTPSAPGTMRIDFGFHEDTGQAIAIQSDGKYVVAGSNNDNSSQHNNNDTFGLARVQTGGSLDSSFGTSGEVTTRIANYSPDALSAVFLNDMTIQPDGKIVAVGYVQGTGVDPFQKYVVARYESGLVTTSISGPASVAEGSPYTLTLSSSDSSTSQWTITWGDGNVQTVGGNPPTVSHTYADGPNNYTISATVTTSTGTSPVGNTVAVSVLNVSPTLSISGASSVNEGSTYTLNLSKSDPGTDTITSWTINWGDGVQTVMGNPSSVTHTYADGNASRTISATATDEDGTFAAGNTVAVAVNNVAPTLAISGVASVNEGALYTLNLLSSDPGADTITSWTINWGDGSQVVSGNPSSVTHTYADGPNAYNISATATDEDGTFSSNSIAVSVNNVAPTLTISGAASVNEGALYTLGLSSFDPGTETITSWTINWGDGSQVVSGNPTSVTHTYADGPNGYTISATATDEDGTFTSNSIAVTVDNVAPALTLSGAASVNEGAPYALNLSSFDPGTDTISSWTINWGDGSQVVPGNSTSVTHTYADGPNGYTISATATDEDGTFSSNSIGVSVNNVPPTTSNATFTIAENSPNGTVVGTVTANDPGNDTLSFSIVGGTGATAFAINSATGQITVADSSQLDFETTPTLTLNVQVSDGDGGFANANVTVNLVNLASVSGVVFVDANHNGLFDANETGIDGVVIKLLDQSGNAVLDELGQAITETTSSGGFYLFDDIGPGIYQLFEMQPTGVTDGAEHLGSLGGTVVANDRMQLTLAGVDAYDYAFAEFGQQVKTGDAATIGFWQNKNGQALITQGGTQLAAWLTANFSNVFGNTLVGATGADVATFYRDQLFKQQSKKSAGPAKVDAQFMAVALATYFTSHTLAGSVAAAYGFNVTDTGIGTRIVNVGTKGAAFGVANGSDRTIMQLLLATDDLTDQPNNFTGFATVYDTNGNGVISTTEASLRTMANDLYSFINEAGGV